MKFEISSKFHSGLILWIFLICNQVSGQVERSKLYVEGDSLYAIRSGISLNIPNGWKGGVLQDTRLLTLVKNNPSEDQMYVSAILNANLDEVKTNWEQGIDLGYGLVSQVKGQIDQAESSLSAEFVSDNTVSAQRRTFGMSKCGPFEVCVTGFVSGPAKYGTENQQALIELMNSVNFVEPQPETDESFVEWSEFFKNKYVYTYELNRGNKRVNQIWFCENGTFVSKLKRRGELFQLDNKHMLKKKTGKWSISDKGQSGVLTINYDDDRVPEFSVAVEMVDQKLFINGNRHYRNVIESCPE
jgi:hypothetical protein